ncbi:ASCH domain-containing protein [Proteinivorax hydrogeniformans]|uniref:ASCH domain-containing protein n=1 Tax=Proteinivorax hydrogeniformans TaxID=1826727 RepID=A0AAU8HXE5_9FIRM
MMKLNPSPFQMIKEGTKTIELRLFDEKRRKISIGDKIYFVNTANNEKTLCAIVENLFVFNSFEELYKNLPLLECGYTEENAAEASPNKIGNKKKGVYHGNMR